MDVIEFCTYLEDKNFDEDIVQRFSRNKICGFTFLSLSEDDLKELLPVIGERVRVRQFLKETKQVCSHTRCCSACHLSLTCHMVPLRTDVASYVHVAIAE